MDTAKKNRRVFITGGTGSVGQALVRAFSEQKHDVVFQYRDHEDIAATLNALSGVSAWRADFTGSFDLPDGTFDIIINSAGILLTKTLAHEVDDDEWEQTIAVNLTAPFKIIRRYLPD